MKEQIKKSVTHRLRTNKNYRVNSAHDELIYQYELDTERRTAGKVQIRDAYYSNCN